MKIPIDKIYPNPWNPNKMDNKEFKHLVKEIKRVGFLQPILVRKIDEEKYEIIDGEHRWRAAKEVGLKEVDAVVIEVDNDGAKILTLNMNRIKGYADPDEEIRLIGELVEKMGMEEVSELVNLSKAEEELLKELKNVEENIEIEDSDIKVRSRHRKEVTCPNCGHQFEI